ncbi:hypothetical protein NSND_60753 [Nitrospira sp. ND1]|nr:hypothetical protein NSND_60753 [Nitrospira sp. ND1]
MEPTSPKLLINTRESVGQSDSGNSPLSPRLRNEISAILAEALLADLQSLSRFTVSSPPQTNRKLKLTSSDRNE